MKIFWNDCGREVPSDTPVPVDVREATRIWSDEIRGVQGNYLGLVDDGDRTIQFYYDADIQDDVEDARHLQIVLLDFPQIEQKGSYNRHVTVGEVHSLIEKVFEVGIDHRQFGALTFEPW